MTGLACFLMGISVGINVCSAILWYKVGQIDMMIIKATIACAFTAFAVVVMSAGVLT